MEHSPPSAFKSDRSKTEIGLIEAICKAKDTVADIAGLRVDAVAHCERNEDHSWKVIIDVIESNARMGDNDLISSYEVRLGATGQVLFCSRIRRYRREEMGVA